MQRMQLYPSVICSPLLQMVKIHSFECAVNIFIVNFVESTGDINDIIVDYVSISGLKLCRFARIRVEFGPEGGKKMLGVILEDSYGLTISFCQSFPLIHKVNSKRQYNIIDWSLSSTQYYLC